MKISNSGLSFTISKKGYAVDEVDKYIKDRENFYEKQLSEQRERISLLKNKNYELENQVADYAEHENEIKKSIVAANEKANEMTLDLKLQYAMEVERLKIFQAKWTNAYEELKERYHFSKDALNFESVVTQTAVELEEMLSRDFSLEKSGTGTEIERQFKGEVKRLKGEDNDVAELFEKLKVEIRKAAKEKEAAADTEKGFKMEDVLRPDEPLEEICKSLGISGSKRA